MKPIQAAFFGLLTVLLGGALVWWLLGRPATGIDDADIFLVYARNFAEGHGFVYNVGGERVEGFTSMLWTLICSVFWHTCASVPVPLLLLNVLFCGAAAAACLRRTERPVLYLALLGASPAWFAWCQTTLMESGLWCLLVTLLVLAVAERRTVAVCLLLPLLVLTRPESIAWGAWACLILAFSKGWKSALWPAAVFGASLLALVGFRLSYFGYPVPNTYYAKVSPDLFSNIWSGLGYLFGYAFSNPAALLALLFLCVVLARRGPGFWVALALLPGLGIPVLVGGDHFGAYRFFQPLWPLLCLLVAREWLQWSSNFCPRVMKTVPVVLLAVGWLLFPATANLEHEFRIAREGRANGEALTAMFSDLADWPTVAVITAGGSKLAYAGTVQDLMGLNSTEMAHAPGPHTGFKNHTGFSKVVFYRWMPDVLLCGDSAEFDALVLQGLHSEPRFMERYEKRALRRNGRELDAYYRRGFLAGLGIQAKE
ncbi:hypothetical protein SCARR_03632 [Pontiella sulfatireligans]|uniref:Glycosyltransferase RgtA/B/C/D-like domain-containing protein n=2 Tax=Pontiella sulfatireligans TaxID=2750658 RepID=A0A6C2UN15_9BACT|nr:hypothetical protein SCARR_03632 [Pontiella sulfatireligans]